MRNQIDKVVRHVVQAFRSGTHKVRRLPQPLYGLLLVGALCAFFACEDEDSELGESLVTTSFYNVYVDTCYVDIATVLLDSIETIGDTIAQIGHYQDDSWGEVTSIYYTEFNRPTLSPNSDYGYTFDSLTIRFIPSGDYWGDTIPEQRVNIHQISRAIILDNDESLYNINHREIDDEVLTSFVFSPKPEKQTTIEVRLPDELGEQWLNDLVVEDDYLDSQSDFKKVFPGLAFVPEDDGSCITGFSVNDSSMLIQLYYKRVRSSTTSHIIYMTANTDFGYNGILFDRTGTDLTMDTGIENLVHSYDTDNKAYMQGLTGFYNQIEFPYINNLESEGEIVSVEDAYLYLYPVRKSYDYSRLPEDIYLYITDENNVLEDYVYGSDGVTVQTGNLDYDESYRYYYLFDMTEFVRNNFGTWGSNRQKLLMNMPDEQVAQTFNQVIFQNDPTEDKRCKLAIRYKVYNEK